MSVDGRQHYVQGVPFKICSIGNYGKENHEVGADIWLQSDFNSKDEVYYRLGPPSIDYLRFHEGFVWLANLAKHFVDYCEEAEGDVTVWDFESKFSQWVKSVHAESAAFNKWYQELLGEDFRIAVARNIRFLYKESVGVDNDLGSLSIWGELLRSDTIPLQRVKEQMTVVTPYVYECFKDTRFGHLLKAVKPVKAAGSREMKTGYIPKAVKHTKPVGFRDSLQTPLLGDRSEKDLPTVGQCMALTAAQCQIIQDCVDPLNVRNKRDWEPEHQVELIRQYMTMRTWKAIAQAMKPKLVYS